MPALLEWVSVGSNVLKCKQMMMSLRHLTVCVYHFAPRCRYVFGDVASPSEEAAILLESIVHNEMRNVVSE